jgi:AcrR family transcriptional regulator
MADAATAPEPARRSYAGATDAQRRGARRERLLDAGLAIIGTQGYSAATLRAVCAAAGLTERYFYESFANREALLAGVHARLVDELSAGLREAFAARRPAPAPRSPPSSGCCATIPASRGCCSSRCSA